MSQHDFDIANQGFPATRADLNNALKAAVSNSAGTSAPSTTYAYQFWYDSNNNIIKMRNGDNDAWISVATVDQTNDLVSITHTGMLDLVDDDGSASIRFQAPSAVTSTTTFTLPDGDGDSGQTLITNGSGTLAWHAPYGNRSLIVNGAMNVAQRSASVTGLGDGDEGYVTVDRMRHTAAASAGRFTSAQTAVSDLPGFLNCLHLDCTTADTSIAATELLIIEQRLEGQNLQQLKKGTSSAEPVTVSFYMKTNKAFTFMCALNDYDNNRVNTQQFTTTTSWTRHSITFAGDTSGALGDDTGHSLSVEFYLHAGSNFTGGSYSANTWQSRASSDNMRAVGIGSFYDSTDNDVKLTGLQVEIGNQATPFEYEHISTTLGKCHRYYYQLAKSGAGSEIIIAGATSGGTNFSAYMPLVMRAAPSITFPTSASVRQGSSTYNVSSWQSFFHPDSTFTLNATMASSATANTASFAYSFQNDIDFDAEL